MSAAKAGNIIDAPAKTEAINTGNMYGKNSTRSKLGESYSPRNGKQGKSIYQKKISARNEKGQARAWGMKRNGQNVKKDMKRKEDEVADQMHGRN